MESLCLFSTSMGRLYGGTETFVITLAEHLRKSIPDLRLVTGGKEEGFTHDYRGLLSRDGISSHRFPMIDRHSLPGRMLGRSWLGTKIGPMDLESFSALPSLPRIRKFITGCEVIEAHYPLDAFLFPFLPRNTRKILHFHGAWPPPLFRRLWRTLSGHLDMCIACSSYARDELQRVMGDVEIDVLYNGVDTDVFCPGDSRFEPQVDYEPGCLRIGTVARLSQDKGADLLCRAVAELGGKVELFLVGPVDPAFKPELDRLSQRPNIHVLGSLPHAELPDFYRFLDCFVLPSRFEAFPLTVLEAMGGGCAVIATDVGGIPEMLGESGGAGLLFPADDMKGLIRNVRILTENQELLAQLQWAGRERVNRLFSLQGTVDGALKLYEKVSRGA